MLESRKDKVPAVARGKLSVPYCWILRDEYDFKKRQGKGRLRRIFLKEGYLEG